MVAFCKWGVPMKRAYWVAIAIASLVPTVADAQFNVQWATPAAASTATGTFVYFPMGTPLQLTTRTELNTKDSHAGDRFYLEVAEPLVYRGQVVVPVGSIAVGEVMRAERNGHFGKRGQLDVRLDYVQTPSGPVRLSGRTARKGSGQGLLAIGGGAVIAWPMLFIHGTSGRLPADTAMTAYLADDLRFTLAPGSIQGTAVASDTGQQSRLPLPERFDPSVFSSSRR